MRSMETTPVRSTVCVAMPSASSVSRSAWPNRSASSAGRMPRSGSVWNGSAGSADAESATAPACAPAHCTMDEGEVEMPCTVEYCELRALP